MPELARFFLLTRFPKGNIDTKGGERMGKSKKFCKKKFCKGCDHGVVINGKAYCISEIRSSACKNFYPKEKR